jgi:STE24 endopeptidase
MGIFVGMTAETILLVYLVLLALEFLLEQGLSVTNMMHVRRLRLSPPQQALVLMQPEEYRKSVDYTLDRSRLSLVSTTVHAGVILLLVLTGWLGDLQQAISGLSRVVGPSLSSVLFVYVCMLLFALISLPFSLYSQFVIEARYGFNRMGIGLFVLDTLKSLAISLVIMTPLLFGLFALVNTTRLWWLWAFLFFAAFQIVMVYLYPKLIAPLFNRYTPLEAGTLKQRLDDLAQRLEVRTQGIYVVDGSRRSAHSNAYFTGFGGAKRIVLFDTLIHGMGEDQVAAVLAHEVGHQKLRHVTIRIAVTLSVVALGFWIMSLVLRQPLLFTAFGFAAPSAAAAIVLVLYFAGPLSLLIRPLGSWWSRRQEYGADRYARDTAGEGEHLRKALIGLSRDNLSNPTPHPWYSFVHYSHPTVLERVRALEMSSERT